jgi:hypothetical protein
MVDRFVDLEGTGPRRGHRASAPERHAIVRPLSNVAGAHLTRNYRWYTAAGARRSMVDDGLTFGTNRDAGVCVHFREPVPSPLRRKGHSALTVTVDNVEGLAERLEAGAS